MSEDCLPSAINCNEQPHGVALILLAHVLQKPKTWVLAHPDTHLNPDQKAHLEQLVNRLQAGEPLPYLTGKQAFYGLDFAVSPAVLIPRPETELLVEEALNWLEAHPDATHALDVGTGSGSIAITLATRKPLLTITATDFSPAALVIAQQNAATHQVDTQINFEQADLLPSENQVFDLVCANLPYIPSHKLVEVNTLGFEPTLALDGGADGLSLIRRLLEQLPTKLNSPALVLLETEATLGEETLMLAKTAFPQADVSLLQDLAGLDRLVRIEIS
ncbi:MAG TPA: peptide chain release factor N(5)-glutamine methyltransferase [Anaerolineaceae bacterium]|nr:peptide chain release factor N(5)-glutamine methyltransferase [Anaerolineaceae bacterium]